MGARLEKTRLNQLPGLARGKLGEGLEGEHVAGSRHADAQHVVGGDGGEQARRDHDALHRLAERGDDDAHLVRLGFGFGFGFGFGLGLGLGLG